MSNCEAMADYHEQDDTEMRDAFVSVTETQKVLGEHQAPMVRLTFGEEQFFLPFVQFSGFAHSTHILLP